MEIEEVLQKFPGRQVRCANGNGGLPCLEVKTPLASATVYLYGGHVAHFQPAGEKPVLFMSQKSLFETGKPIRGGVPVCFPWFGPKADDASAPMHGLVRLQTWQLVRAEQLSGDEIEIDLETQSSDSTRKFFAGDYRLVHRIRIGRELSMSLIARNTGKAAFTVQEALHTYFAVGDVKQVSVRGLEPTGYFDKVQAMRACPAAGAPIAITAETDRHYPGTVATTSIVDPSLQRRIIIAKSGSQSTVVWNPWIAKAAALADFGDDEWQRMLCVETANFGDDSVKLAPGAEHTMQARISVERL